MNKKLTLKTVPAVKCTDACKSCLYFGDEYVGIIRDDIAQEMIALWAEAHIEETIAQRVARRLWLSNCMHGYALIKLPYLSRTACTEVEIATALQECRLAVFEDIADSLSLTLAELFAEEEPKI